jgi:hypothetical protein
VRFSNAGLAHPDAKVASLARQWAEYESRPVWWNRLPPWLLPLVAAVLIAVGLMSGVAFLRWVIGGGGLIPLVLGLLAWNARQAAKQVLAATPPDT